MYDTPTEGDNVGGSQGPMTCQLEVRLYPDNAESGLAKDDLGTKLGEADHFFAVPPDPTKPDEYGDFWGYFLEIKVTFTNYTPDFVPQIVQQWDISGSRTIRGVSSIFPHQLIFEQIPSHMQGFVGSTFYWVDYPRVVINDIFTEYHLTYLFTYELKGTSRGVPVSCGGRLRLNFEYIQGVIKWLDAGKRPYP